MDHDFDLSVQLQVPENLWDDSWSWNTAKVKNKRIAFLALFFNYWQLKIGRNTPAREQTSLHERKEVSLSNGMHSDPQTERHMGCSLRRTSRKEEDCDIQRRKLHFAREISRIIC